MSMTDITTKEHVYIYDRNIDVPGLCRAGHALHWLQFCEELAQPFTTAALLRAGPVLHLDSTTDLGNGELVLAGPEGGKVKELTFPCSCNGVSRAHR